MQSLASQSKSQQARRATSPFNSLFPGFYFESPVFHPGSTGDFLFALYPRDGGWGELGSQSSLRVIIFMTFLDVEVTR